MIRIFFPDKKLYRSDYAGLYNFLSGKKIRIKNLEGIGDEVVSREPVYNENEIYGLDDEMGEEESEDEDFDANAKDSADESDSADDGTLIWRKWIVNSRWDS